MRVWLLMLALAGCREGSMTPSKAEPVPERAEPEQAPPAKAVSGADDPLPTCRKVSFAASIPVEEASGAAWMGDRMLVVADSGNRGQYVEVDENGKVVGSGNLPLDGGASDDLEGLVRVGELVYAITSSGYLRTYKRSGNGFEQVDLAYAAGPVPAFSCEMSSKVNCGLNFEGLCLHGGRGDGCAGFAAAKSDGHLYCLTWSGDKLVADPERRIRVTTGAVLTGCSFDDRGRLWAGTNFFARNAVYLVEGWKQPASAQARLVGRLGPGFGEAILAGPGGTLYRFSDMGGSPSAVEKFVCK